MRKSYSGILIMTITLLLCSSAGARNEISLNGEWEIQYSRNGDQPSDSEWATVNVPSHLEQREEQYVWYKRTFTVPDARISQNVFLKFGGVKFVLEVYVNGKRVGGHYGGWEPFEVNITDNCKYGEENQLLVRVTDMRGVIQQELVYSERVEGQRFIEQAKDSVMAPVGSRPDIFGIWQDVALELRSDVYIDDVFIRTSVRSKTVEADFRVANLSDRERKVRLLCQVHDGEEPRLDAGNIPANLPPNSITRMTWKEEWESPKLWSPESPHLYSLVSRLTADESDSVMDEISTRFGFREFWIDGIHFVLNGTKINFLATAGHPDYDDTKEDAKKLYADIRSANCVAMRLHANIWPELWYEAADEAGMLLIQESALWCFANEYALSKPEFWENMKDHLSGMIRRDKNHPSVVMYSIENEILHCGGDRVPETEERLAELGRFVKGIDPTRPIMYDGDADPMGVADVENLHYPHEFPEWNMWPGTGYWVKSTTQVSGWPRKEWKWERQKPLYMGEFLWIPARTPDPYTIFLGDDAYPDPRAARARSKAAAWAMQVEAFRADGVSGICPWTLLESGKFPNVQSDAIKRAYEPNAAFIEEYDSNFYSGQQVQRTIRLYNDTLHPADLKFRWRLGEESGERELHLAPADSDEMLIEFRMPGVSERTPVSLFLEVENGGKLAFQDEKQYWMFPKQKLNIPEEAKIAAYTGGVMPTRYRDLPSLSDIPPDTQLLIIFPGALKPVEGEDDIPVVGDESAPGAKLAEFVRDGGTVLVLQQDVYPEGLLPASLTSHSSTIAFRRAYDHDILKGVRDEDLRWWGGYNRVSQNDVAEPTGGCFRAIVDSGGEGGLVYLPLMEVLSGRGRYILCQLSLIEKLDCEDPIAWTLFQNILDYSLKPTPERVRTGVIQHEQGIKRDVDSVGAVCDDLSGKLSQKSLKDYGVIAAEAGAPEVSADIDKIREFVQAGGKLILHGLTPGNLERLKALFPEEVALSRSTSVPVTIFQRDPVISGLANHDLYWLGKHVGAWEDETPLSQEIIDYVVARGLPEPEKCQTMEAEDMAFGRGNPRLTEDGIYMFMNGSVVGKIDFPESTEYTFGVRASGTPYHGVYPEVALLVDDVRRSAVTLDRRDWGVYTMTAYVEKGKHEIALEFTNDSYDPVTKEDRNLSLDRLMYAESLPTSVKSLLAPAALAKVPLGEGFILIDQINWHGRAASQDNAARYLTNLLVNLGVPFVDSAGFLSIPGGKMKPAENLTLYSISGSIARLGTNGYMYSDARFASSREYAFEVNARGTEAGGEYPNIRLAIDGEDVGEQMLQYPGWGTLTFRAFVSAGTHRISLAFTNDYWEPPEDRNLEIGRLSIK